MPFQEAQPRRILVVEDDPIARHSIRNLLQRRGYEVVAMDDGTPAVQAVEREHFDCIIMDIQMPVMDGVEATRKIRRLENEKMRRLEDENNSSIPASQYSRISIIAVTGYAMTGGREKFLEAGMDDYLAKPERIKELEKVLHRMLTAPSAK